MSSRMPPVTPASRSKHELHPNSSEKGDAANIKQNTTNEGYFGGRRQS